MGFLFFHIFLLSVVGFLTQAKEKLTVVHISDAENVAAVKDVVVITPKEKHSAPFAVDPGSPHFP